MNKAILMGRLTRDPELRQTSSGISVCSFTLAVDRRFKSANGERETDFIPVVAWRQQAEFVTKYFRQGAKVAVIGSIQVRSWDDKEDGRKRYATEIIAEEVYFADSKNNSDNGSTYNKSNGDSFSRPRSENTFINAPVNNSLDDDNDDFFATPSDDTSLPFDL